MALGLLSETQDQLKAGLVRIQLRGVVSSATQESIAKALLSVGGQTQPVEKAAAQWVRKGPTQHTGPSNTHPRGRNRGQIRSSRNQNPWLKRDVHHGRQSQMSIAPSSTRQPLSRAGSDGRTAKSHTQQKRSNTASPSVTSINSLHPLSSLDLDSLISLNARDLNSPNPLISRGFKDRLHSLQGGGPSIGSAQRESVHTTPSLQRTRSIWRPAWGAGCSQTSVAKLVTVAPANSLNNPCGCCGKPTRLLQPEELPPHFGCWKCDLCGTNGFRWHDQLYGCDTFASCNWAKCDTCWNPDRFNLPGSRESSLPSLRSDWWTGQQPPLPPGSACRPPVQPIVARSCQARNAIRKLKNQFV